MHYKVKKLTGFDKERLSRGVLFPEAFRQFREWCGEGVTFLSSSRARLRSRSEKLPEPPELPEGAEELDSPGRLSSSLARFMSLSVNSLIRLSPVY